MSLTVTEAHAVVRLVRHLYGSVPGDTAQLVDEAELLADRAGQALQVSAEAGALDSAERLQCRSGSRS